MKKSYYSALSAFACAVFMLCSACGASATSDSATSVNDIQNNNMTQPQTTPADTTSAKVKVETSAGDFTVLLYGDTPAHRDNFVKLAKEGYYDGTLFHRVIKDFMVQAGDPDSKSAQPGQHLGSGGPGYTLPAEIVYPKHFHKRGALAAARTGDQVNPERRSSGSQFYVVTGNVYSPDRVEELEAGIKNSKVNTEAQKLMPKYMDRARALQMAGDYQGLQALENELIREAMAAVEAQGELLTPEMRQAYTTVGGAPHLDGQYTVFGEVIDGMEVIDAIEKAATDAADRPLENIVIKKMTVL